MKRPAVILCVLLFLFLFAIPLPVHAAANLAANPGFEETPERVGWSEYIWDKKKEVSQIFVDNTVAHSGKASICIVNNGLNDARLLQKIQVSGNRTYRLSCWIKAEYAGPDAKGANLSVEGLINTTKDLKSTDGWEKVELYGTTGNDQDSFVLTVGIGGYSNINTGKAWFDDVSVEETDTVPPGVEPIKLYREDLAGVKAARALKAVGYHSDMLVYFIIFLSVFALLAYLGYKSKRTIGKNYVSLLLLAILLAAFLVRVFLAEVMEGWPGDIATNKAWATAAANGLSTFYSSVWCDYPPLLMYIFAIVGKLAAIPSLAPHFTLLIKLPAILADVATSYLIYRIASKQLKPALALAAAAAYAFNPAVFVDSTIWGQVDSLFTLIVASALVLMINRKLEASAVLLTAATLMKPQGIFFLPVMLFELIKQRKAGKFLSVIFCGLVTTILIILPFAINQEPLWIFKLYLTTGKEYPYASMNPFNVFTLAGGNFVDGATKLFLFSFNTWGILFDLIILAIAAYIHLKSRHTAAPIVVAALLNAGAFIFSVKMHERYLFPVVALLLLAVVYLKDKKMLLIFAGFTTTVFFNIHLLFYRMLRLGVTESYFSADSPDVILFSLLNIVLFVCLVKVSRDILIDNISDRIARSGGTVRMKRKGGA